MAIVMSPTREKYPLSTKKIMKKVLGGTMAWIFFLLIFYGFGAFWLAFFDPSMKTYLLIITGAFIFLLLFLVVVNYLYQKWYFDVYFYDLTSDYVIIKKGPITPHEITIPYERVQDVYVDQDLFDRFFGLYDVHLSSATVSSGMEAHIDGLEKPAADGLKQLLLQTVTAKIGKKKPEASPAPEVTTPPAHE